MWTNLILFLLFVEVFFLNRRIVIMGRDLENTRKCKWKPSDE